MVANNLVRSLFWHLTLQSDSRHGAPCSWVSATPAASPTPTRAPAQRAEDRASSGGTCCKCFLPTRCPHEGSGFSRGSPDTAVLRNMGQGWHGWLLSIWKMRCRSARGVGRNFADGAEAGFLFRTFFYFIFKYKSIMLYSLVLRPVESKVS